MAESECSECGAKIAQRDGMEEGEILTCPDCGSKLEVKSISPFSVALAPSVQEDWGE